MLSTKNLVVPNKELGAFTVRCSKRYVVPTERESFGDYVRRVADEEKLKYREIARRGGISAPTVSDIISGKTKQVKGDTLLALAKGLGRSPEEVLAAYQGVNRKNDFEESDFARLYFKHSKLTKARQKEFERIWSMVERDYDRALLDEEKTGRGGK